MKWHQGAAVPARGAAALQTVLDALRVPPRNDRRMAAVDAAYQQHLAPLQAYLLFQFQKHSLHRHRALYARSACLKAECLLLYCLHNMDFGSYYRLYGASPMPAAVAAAFPCLARDALGRFLLVHPQYRANTDPCGVAGFATVGDLRRHLHSPLSTAADAAIARQYAIPTLSYAKYYAFLDQLFVAALVGSAP